MPSPTLPEPARNEPRGGRDLPAAIATGAALLVPAVIGILFFVEVLILLFSVLLCLGVWEVARALKGQGYNVPVVPLCVGSVGMLVAAYFAAEEGLVLSFALTSALILVWVWASSAVRATPIGAEKPPIQSAAAAVFIGCWVPFLVSFAVLLVQMDDGAWRLTVVVLLVVCNDTFGYIAGRLFGRRPMAPKVSPKKSWEGFAGSLLGAAAVSALFSWVVFDEPLYAGVLLAVIVVVAATAGDFAESMVKREAGIKDMSNALPGHGGVMDRLDSVVWAMPAAYLGVVALGLA
ncbi:phosphatidate cytidylyltransferase [Nesterenkonia sp. NBAIMH1]|uniref:phosphatidate cytidylyltransferase n=1 Tax=Nesterenkonia sp. NBAIMH1 TaxID=2600320 RepID=UPI0011B4D6E5|nr:phosphatidate cytidylyltransferase [Nesterenkonia sp. NBAIMH1]